MQTVGKYLVRIGRLVTLAVRARCCFAVCMTALY
jgi:hypothetical protein